MSTHILADHIYNIFQISLPNFFFNPKIEMFTVVSKRPVPYWVQLY